MTPATRSTVAANLVSNTTHGSAEATHSHAVSTSTQAQEHGRDPTVSHTIKERGERPCLYLDYARDFLKETLNDR